MSDPFNNRNMPAGLLAAVFCLLGFTLLAVAAFSKLKGPASLEVDYHGSVSRDLRFVDLGAGKVGIYVWPEGEQVATLPPGQENFIRGVMRGLARERRGIGVGDDVPFRVTQLGDGRMTLEDLATGRILLLDAFGPTNSDSFKNLITAGKAAG